jgi:hypothetical protein
VRKVSAPKVAGPESVFIRRSLSIYGGMKARAAKLFIVNLPFSLEEFRAWLGARFDADGVARCEYSREMILAENFSVDHQTPISRSGRFDVKRLFALDNLALCSEKQNLRKGNMTKAEYEQFRRYVDCFPPEVQTAIWRKLEIGDVQRFSYYRRQKKERGVR